MNVCDRAVEGLGQDAAMLTGWTSRVIAALAHLREAWCIADAGNMIAAESAIGALIDALYERQSNALPLAQRVLAQGLDPVLADDLWQACGPTRGAPRVRRD